MGDLEELPELLAQLREAIRQGHEVAADLRAATREARAVRDSLPAAAGKAVREELGAVVQEGLVEFGAELQKAIDIGTEAVSKRFSTLEKLFLGEDPKTVRSGKPSIPELIGTIRDTGPQASPSVPLAFRRRVKPPS